MNMNNKNYSKEKSSSNGFVLGLIFGVSLALLFGTKKGRKILEQFSEKGIKTVENFIKDKDILPDLEEDEIEEDFPKTESSNGHSANKRFFKGIKKKS